ncbi:hypothetical protein TELCIR_02198, partial [Teladorsagia circumcincta]
LNQFQLSARISELTDHVEKARLRETELAERVARWVEYLREEKQKMLARGSRLYATGTLSAIISDDIEYNISMLMQMRARVDNKLLEIKQRKREHKVGTFSRLLTQEPDRGPCTFQYWFGELIKFRRYKRSNFHTLELIDTVLDGSWAIGHQYGHLP